MVRNYKSWQVHETGCRSKERLSASLWASVRMKFLALLLAAGIVSLTACSSETLGYVDKNKLDASEKRVAELQKQLADTTEKLSTNQKSLLDLQSHKYSMFQNGSRTWRLNTVTGDSCIALAPKAEWKNKETRQQSCACTDLFEPEHFNPSGALINAYCGMP